VVSGSEVGRWRRISFIYMRGRVRGLALLIVIECENSKSPPVIGSAGGGRRKEEGGGRWPGFFLGSGWAYVFAGEHVWRREGGGRYVREQGEVLMHDQYLGSRRALRLLLHGHSTEASESGSGFCPWRVNQASPAPCSNPSGGFSRTLMTLPLDDAHINSAATFVPRLTSASKSAEETQSRTPAGRSRAQSSIAGAESARTRRSPNYIEVRP
jgi:hypothetical protein